MCSCTHQDPAECDMRAYGRSHCTCSCHHHWQLPQRPKQPLDEKQAEIDRLREFMRALLSEVYVVRSAVEAIYSRETALATMIINALEACHITLREDENDMEIVHVYSHDTRWQTFSRADWEWMYDNGKWPGKD